MGKSLPNIQIRNIDCSEACLQENEQEFMEAYRHIHDMVKKALQSYDEDHM